MKRFLSLIKNNDGSALAFLIVAMVVVFMLATGLVVRSVGENRQAFYMSDETAAYYLARAGAQSMVKQLKRMSGDEVQDIIDAGASGVVAEASTSGGATDVLAGTGTVEVTVTNDPIGSGNFLVSSTGTYSGHTETVKIWQTYETVEVGTLDYAIYAKEDMTDDGSGNINFGDLNGDIAAGGTVYIHSNDYQDQIDAGYIIESGRQPEITVYGFDYSDTEFDDLSTTTLPIYDFRDTSLSFIANNYKFEDSDGSETGISVDTSFEITYDLDGNGSIANPQETDVDLTQIEITESMVIRNFGELNGDETLFINTGNADYDVELANGSHPDDDKLISGGSDWMVVYFDGDSSVTSECTINSDYIFITGNNNLIIMVYDCMQLFGTKIFMPDNIRVDFYILDDGKNDGEDFEITGSISGVEDKPDSLRFIMYGEDSVMNFSNNGTCYAQLISDEGRIELKNGNTELYGSVFAEDVYVAAQTSVIYKEPSDPDLRFGTITTMFDDYWDR